MTDQEILVELLLRWEEAQEKGQSLSAEVICKDHPRLLSSFTEQVALLQKVSWIHQSKDLPPPDNHGGINGGCIDPAKMQTHPQWGRYRIESFLGHGSYGFVWKAWDPELHRTVAIKIPQRRSQQTSQHFSEEAKRIAMLSHPGVVRIFDVGVDHDAVYLVCEFINGKTLDELPFELNSSKYIKVVIEQVAQVADALQYAHNRGVIHGDLKDQNILVDDQGAPKINDFGISNLGDFSDGEVTIGQLLGTTIYMAPELLRGQVTRHTKSTDIYAIGVMLYHMLTKQWPRGYQSSFQFLDNRSPITPLRKHNPAVPIDLEHICLKALADDPEKRYLSAQELANDLRMSLHFPERKKFPWLVAAGVLVASALLTALILVWANSNADGVIATLSSATQPAKQGIALVRVNANSPPHKVFDYRKLVGHTDLVSSLHFLSETTLLSASYDGKILIWDTTKGKVVREVTGLINEGSFSLVFNSQKSKVYLGLVEANKKSVVHEYAYPVFTRLRTLHCDMEESRLHLSLSPDDRYLAATGSTGLCAWDLATGTRTLQIPSAGEPRAITVTADNHILVGFKLDVLKIFNVISGKQLETDEQALSIRAITATGKPHEFVSVGNYGYWMLYDIGKKPAELTKVQPRDSGERQFCVVSRNIDQILIGYQSGIIRLWDIRDKKVLCSFHGMSTTLHSLAVSPDSTQLVSSDERGNICLWKIPASVSSERSLTTP